MAGLMFTVTGTETVGSSPETLVQILPPANQMVKVHKVWLGGLGSSVGSAPGYLEWMIQTSAGSGSSAITPVKTNALMTATIQTGSSGSSVIIGGFSSEPTTTAGALLRSPTFDNQTGFEWDLTSLPDGGFLIYHNVRRGLRYTGSTIDVSFCLLCEE